MTSLLWFCVLVMLIALAMGVPVLIRRGTVQHIDQKSEPLWHYTVGQWLTQIVDAEEIIPATAFVAKGVRPLVWCTYDQNWEQTANKSVMTSEGEMVELDMEQTHEFAGGLVRIQIDPTAVTIDWREYKETSGETKKMAKFLYNVAKERGSHPGDWRGSYEPIPSSRWLDVQFWNGRVWESRPLADELERLKWQPLDAP